MATIYQHNASDRVLILDPREAYQRKLDVGSWNEIRIGIFCNNVGLASSTANYTSEQVTQVSRADALAIGLKDSATSILPGFSGSYYIGMFHTSSYTCTVLTDKYECGGGNYAFNAVGFYGTSSYWGAQNLNSLTYPTNGGGGNASDYCHFYGLKITLNNSGSASQTITINSSAGSYSSGTTYYAIPQLNEKIQSATYSTTSTATWNNGSIAYPIPDSLWIRAPFYFNRLRISALSVIRYS